MGAPVVKTPCSIAGGGTKIPHALRCDQNKKECKIYVYNIAVPQVSKFSPIYNIRSMYSWNCPEKQNQDKIYRHREIEMEKEIKRTDSTSYGD